MIDLNIFHGLSTELFSAPGVVNPDLLIEDGCWYLCTDTAELYLGTKDAVTSELTLKQINSTYANELDSKVVELLNTEISKVNKSLSDYAKKTDIPTVEGLATEEFVQEELNKISIPDVSNFITEAEVEAKGYLTEQDISDKANKGHTHNLTDITDYIAPDLTGYATQEFVSKKIAEAELKDKEADLEAYYTKSEVDALIPDVTDLIKEIPSEYITESELAEELAKIEHPANPTKVSELENDAGYATEQYITNAIANQVPVDNLAKKEEVEEVKTKLETEVLPVVSVVPEVKTTIEELKTTAATQEWVNEQGFITEHQDISNKADKVLFTTAKFVTTPIGNFVMGENIKDLTIAQLYAKLLGLSEVDPSIVPETREEIVEDIKANERQIYQLSDEGIPVEVDYTLTTFINYNDFAAPATNTTFYVFEGADSEGNLTSQAGYQHVTETQDCMYYAVMLPSTLIIGENVAVQTYDEINNCWSPFEFKELVHNPEEISNRFVEDGLEMPNIPNNYTLWVDFSSTNSGRPLRYIIK